MDRGPSFETGEAILQQLLGPDLLAKLDAAAADPISREFGLYAREAAFGMIWARPALDFKTRALICVVSDTALHVWDTLRLHLRVALNVGWTEDELGEALLQMAVYAGQPTAREALGIAREVFAEVRANRSDQS
jgi:4-carboxymuconolactone decarboxylase